MMKKDFSPTVYKYKDSVMEDVENTDLFNSYLKTSDFKQAYNGTLWAEGPCYIPHNDMLVWSDNPNNRMMKLINGQVSEFRNPSNFCNGNTIDNQENLISCSHGGRCVYKTDDDLNVSIVVDSYEGKKFNSPNDICVKSDDTIWFTAEPFNRIKFPELLWWEEAFVFSCFSCLFIAFAPVCPHQPPLTHPSLKPSEREGSANSPGW